MGWLSRIFGKPLWPFHKPTLKETNPCTDAVRKWYIDAHDKGIKVGLVEYYRDRRHWEPWTRKKNRWHMAGTYIDKDGLKVYDVINDKIVTLSESELSEAKWIGLKPENVNV